MEPLRGRASESSGAGSSTPGGVEFSLSLRDFPDCGLRSGARRNNPNRQIAVLIPELVERHWYHYFLHNQRAEWLKELLLLKGNQQIIVIVVPWHLNA